MSERMTALFEKDVEIKEKGKEPYMKRSLMTKNQRKGFMDGSGYKTQAKQITSSMNIRQFCEYIQPYVITSGDESFFINELFGEIDD